MLLEVYSETILYSQWHAGMERVERRYTGTMGQGFSFPASHARFVSLSPVPGQAFQHEKSSTKEREIRIN